MPPSIDFSAAPSALGYLYQVRYSLALLLEATEANCILSLEKLDDVAFSLEGEPVELLQFKHHVNHRASLTDSSPDLWKTLRVWMSKLREGSLDLSSTLLTLVTTSTAPEDSAAYLLREGGGRNEVEALLRDLPSRNLHLRPLRSLIRLVSDSRSLSVSTARECGTTKKLVSSMSAFAGSPQDKGGAALGADPRQALRNRKWTAVLDRFHEGGKFWPINEFDIFPVDPC